MEHAATLANINAETRKLFLGSSIRIFIMLAVSLSESPSGGSGQETPPNRLLSARSPSTSLRHSRQDEMCARI